jgi:hypothetical protein
MSTSSSTDGDFIVWSLLIEDYLPIVPMHAIAQTCHAYAALVRSRLARSGAKEHILITNFDSVVARTRDRKIARDRLPLSSQLVCRIDYGKDLDIMMRDVIENIPPYRFIASYQSAGSTWSGPNLVFQEVVYLANIFDSQEAIRYLARALDACTTEVFQTGLPRAVTSERSGAVVGILRGMTRDRVIPRSVCTEMFVQIWIRSCNRKWYSAALVWFEQHVYVRALARAEIDTQFHCDVISALFADERLSGRLSVDRQLGVRKVSCPSLQFLPAEYIVALQEWNRANDGSSRLHSNPTRPFTIQRHIATSRVDRERVALYRAQIERAVRDKTIA